MMVSYEFDVHFLGCLVSGFWQVFCACVNLLLGSTFKGSHSLKVWAATVVAKTTAATEENLESMMIDGDEQQAVCPGGCCCINPQVAWTQVNYIVDTNYRFGTTTGLNGSEQ